MEGCEIDVSRQVSTRRFREQPWNVKREVCRECEGKAGCAVYEEAGR